MTKAIIIFTRFLSTGVVTASSHTLWRVLLNKVIWVLGHCWINTPLSHTPWRETLCFVEAVCSPPSRSRWVTRIMWIQALLFEHIELRAELLGYFLRRNKSNINQSTVSVRIHTTPSRRSRLRFFAFVPRGAYMPGSCRTKSFEKCGFDSSRNKWIFGSASFLCQGFRRRRKETAWKRRRIKTSLLIVMFTLRVMTYVVFCKVFWNGIAVARFASHEVWSDERFVFCHFLLCCFLQIVSLWTLNIWIWIIFNTNELINQTRHWNQIPHRNY